MLFKSVWAPSLPLLDLSILGWAGQGDGEGIREEQHNTQREREKEQGKVKTKECDQSPTEITHKFSSSSLLLLLTSTYRPHYSSTRPLSHTLSLSVYVCIFLSHTHSHKKTDRMSLLVDTCPTSFTFSHFIHSPSSSTSRKFLIQFIIFHTHTHPHTPLCILTHCLSPAAIRFSRSAEKDGLLSHAPSSSLPPSLPPSTFSPFSFTFPFFPYPSIPIACIPHP